MSPSVDQRFWHYRAQSVGNDTSKIDDLQQLVRSFPDNHDVRRQLVEALLDGQRLDEADEHLRTLLAVLPNTPGVLLLAERVANAHGDHLQAARYRRALRHWTEKVEVDPEPDDEFPQYSGHPSQSEALTIPTGPQLRLLSGGATAADGPAPVGGAADQLDDIPGLETVRRCLHEVIDSVRHTTGGDRGSSGQSRSWLGGLLLYGPPNCGKAYLAATVARELNASFWSFDLSTVWHKDSLGEVVRRAIGSGGSKPAVIYLDNLDAPTHDTSGTMEAAMSTVLPLLDGAHGARGEGNGEGNGQGKVVLFGAATLPWLVSPSLLRAGRLSRVLLVLPPDGPARRAFLADRFHRRALVGDVDVNWLVDHTEGHSFGDLDELVDMAISLAQADTQTLMPELQHTHIRRARQRVAPSSAEWLTTAGHHALMNEAGGLYDDLLRYFHYRQRH